ncbi:MAG TPA: beta-ketoacyl-ACP synthase III [Holophaga sp.]|nr:beta-ketoacyl-ACP synthase III [Holophaga sp.]
MTRRFESSVGITATGEFYPDRVVTNEDLAKMVDTSDEWITARTGISHRRWVEPGVGSSDLGAKALQMALDRRGITADELDGIIACTVTPDMMFPCTAALIQTKVGARNAFGFDLNAACSSWLFGLTTAASMVAGGGAKRLAVVGCDVMTSIFDKTDRNTAVLFGDGAGAAIVEAVEDGFGILDFEQKVDGKGAPYLCMPAGGSLKPASHATVDAREHYVFQQGQEVFKNAVREMAEVSRLMLDRNHVDPADLKLFVPHQANVRIMDAALKRLELPREKMASNIGEFANTTSATIPTALHQSFMAGKLKQGDLVVLASFGAGFTWGGVLLRWAF